MVFYVILLFAVSWFPLYCVFVIVKFGDDFLLNDNIQYAIYVIVPIAQWLGAANSCINPFLFVHMDTRFRIRLMVRIHLRCCHCWSPVCVEIC